MLRYWIEYREGVERDASDGIVDCHRMEGWTSDYVFFSHDNLKIPSLVIPREIVRHVRLITDSEGNRPNRMGEDGNLIRSRYGPIVRATEGRDAAPGEAAA